MAHLPPAARQRLAQDDRPDHVRGLLVDGDYLHLCFCAQSWVALVTTTRIGLDDG